MELDTYSITSYEGIPGMVWDSHGDWVKREAVHKIMGIAITLACPMCKKGYPLQRSGGRHNDMKGRDTLINNMCRAAELREHFRKYIGKRST